MDILQKLPAGSIFRDRFTNVITLLGDVAILGQGMILGWSTHDRNMRG